jgi:predicted acyl esterase
VPEEVVPLDATKSFRDAPVTGADTAYVIGGSAPSYDVAVCRTEDANGAVAAVYDTEPLRTPATVAGNPFAVLDLSSDQPRGVVSVDVYDLAPDARCADPSSSSGNVGIRFLSHGAADLAYYRTRFTPTAFPVGTAQKVRIDLLDTAATVPAGHRLRVVVSYGSAVEKHLGRVQDLPLITVHDDSELVLPVLEGTVGGRRPAHAYPARPLLP